MSLQQRVDILDKLLRIGDEEWFDQLATPELINHSNDDGRSIMWSFCHDEQKLKKLVALGGDVNILAPRNRSFIQCATSSNSCHIIRLLVCMGCNVNYQEPREGLTALAESYLYNTNLKVAETLLECGADPLIKDYSGKKILDYTPNKNCVGYFLMIHCKLAERAFIDAMRRKKVMVPDVIQLTARMIWSTRHQSKWVESY